MNKKSLIILCVIFFILLGLVVVKNTMKPKIPTTEEIADIIAPPINNESLSEITIRLGDGATEDKESPRNVDLVKAGEQWIVKTQYGVLANEKAITPVLEILDQLKGELRSDKKGLLGDYGIGDKEGVHLILKQKDGKDIHIVVGTQKTGNRNNFVRLSKSNAVYVVGENLLSTLGVRGEDDNRKLDVHKWVDKRIAHIKTDEIAGIAIKQKVGEAEETTIDIRKNSVDGKSKWQSVKPYSFNLSASKIKATADKFNKIYAREVVAPDVKGVFDSPAWVATFTMENDDQIKLVRGNTDEGENNYYVKQEGAGYYYLVPITTFDSREKKQGDIFADNPLKVEENSIEGLEIKDLDNKKQMNVVKKVLPKETEEVKEEVKEGEVPKKESKEGFVWETSGGETVDEANVKKVIDKLKAINVEAVGQLFSSLKESLVINITQEGEAKKYTVSQDVKLDSGKECHLLRTSGDDQDYCVSKAQVKALRDALP